MHNSTAIITSLVRVIIFNTFDSISILFINTIAYADGEAGQINILELRV